MMSDKQRKKTDRAQLDSRRHWIIVSVAIVVAVVLVLTLGVFDAPNGAYETASDDIVTNCDPQYGAGCGMVPTLKTLPVVAIVSVAVVYGWPRYKGRKNDQ